MGISRSAIFRVALAISTASAFLAIGNADTPKSGATSTLAPRSLPVKPALTEISPRARLSHVTVKFTDEAVVRSVLSRGRVSLVSRGGADLTPALAILQPYLANSGVSRLFSLPVDQLERDRARRERVAGMRLADLACYYQVAVTDPAEAEDLINRLNQLAVVEIALAEPVPEYAGWMDAAAPDYSGSQDYLRPAPDGVDADYAGTVLGGDGAGVKVIDVEGGWRTSHEDLAANPPFVTIGGQIGALDWRNHGTAVIGEIMGIDNGFGMTGIAPGIQWGYSSIGTQTTANALLNAGAALDPGDVILIELHAPGPHYDFESREDQKGYVCMEYWQTNFDVIQQLFFDGIVVCEAAGNGSENYDDPGYYGSLFDTTFRNSHAIICGAGAPPSGQYGADRSRLGFSNYGERVNLQGYGAGVYTTGYGGLFDGGSEDSWYTATFSGTSSASPIITGAVAALQGAHKANFGFPMDADAIRTLLYATGTPQTGATTEHIGPRPNLQAAFDEALGVSLTVDETFGPAPLAVQFTGASTKTVTSWLWDFGDGETSSEQSPAHVYDQGGLFSVVLTVETTEGDYSATRPNFVAAAADTIDGLEASGAAGSPVKLDVYAYNSLPVIQYKIPVEYAGPLNLTLDSASVDGLRSSAMNLALTSFNPFSRQATYTLTATGGLASYLPGGGGPILSLFFTIPPGAPNDVNFAMLDGYGVETPLVATEWGSFSPVVDPGMVSLDCVTAGDADGSGTINIGDVTFIITAIFSSGPLPDPLGLGDADCNGSVNIADVTYLLSWTFSSGPPPCACAP